MGMRGGQSRTSAVPLHHWPLHSFYSMKQDLSLNLGERLAANKLQQFSCLCSQQLWNMNQDPCACTTNSHFLLIHRLIFFPSHQSTCIKVKSGSILIHSLSGLGSSSFKKACKLSFFFFAQVFIYDTLFGNNFSAQEKVLLLFNMKKVMVELLFVDRKRRTNADMGYSLQDTLDTSIHHINR